MARAEGLEGPSRPPLKFGAFFFDYDLDGRLDLLTCNGHLEPDITSVQRLAVLRSGLRSCTGTPAWSVSASTNG